jgi:cytoskeletal protein CcmA (bactofilin family)
MSRRGRRQGGRGPDEPSEPGIKETLGPEMTVVGRGAQLEGTLVSTESIRIDGQAKGKIAARVDVILSSDSHVEADIQAENVVAGGTLKGSISARTMTEVAEGGRVEGTIRSKALVVSEGALFSRTPQVRQPSLHIKRTSCGWAMSNRSVGPPSGTGRPSLNRSRLRVTTA